MRSCHISPWPGACDHPAFISSAELLVHSTMPAGKYSFCLHWWCIPLIPETGRSLGLRPGLKNRKSHSPIFNIMVATEAACLSPLAEVFLF